MDNKIELRLAGTAQHELHVAPDLLWAFGAVLAANKRFVTLARHGLTPTSRKYLVRLHKIDDRIHPGAAVGEIVHHRQDSPHNEFSWEG